MTLHDLSAPEIVNWVTTADGCGHRRRDETRQLRLVGVGGVYWALRSDMTVAVGVFQFDSSG